MEVSKPSGEDEYADEDNADELLPDNTGDIEEELEAMQSTITTKTTANEQTSTETTGCQRKLPTCSMEYVCSKCVCEIGIAFVGRHKHIQ